MTATPLLAVVFVCLLLAVSTSAGKQAGTNSRRRIELSDFSTEFVSFEVVDSSTTVSTLTAPSSHEGLTNTYSSGGNPASSSEYRRLLFHYQYHGSPSVDILVEIMDFECKQIVQNGPVTSSSPAPHIVRGKDGFDLLLDLDIEAAQATESQLIPFWFRDSADPTKAEIKFCVSLAIIETSASEHVFTSTTKAMVAVETVAGSFLTVAGPSGTRGDKPFAEPSSATLTISFPLEVYVCDANAMRVYIPAAVTMGQPVRFCVAMKFPSNTAHVSSVDNIYFKNAADTVPVGVVVEDGQFRSSLVNIDCAIMDRVCLVEFIVPAMYYSKNSPLVISGAASVSLGLDEDSRPPLRALVAAQNIFDDNNSDVQEESRVPFTYEVELLQSKNYSVKQESTHVVSSKALVSTGDCAILAGIQMSLTLAWIVLRW